MSALAADRVCCHDFVVAIFLQHSDSLVPVDVLITYMCSPGYLCIASQASLMRGIAQYILAHLL